VLQVYTSEARDEWRSLYLAASFMYVSWSWLYTKNESNRVGLANGTLERERSVDSQPRYLCLALCFPTFLLNVFLTSAKPTIRCSEGRERKRKEMKPMRQMPVSRFQLITHHSRSQASYLPTLEGQLLAANRHRCDEKCVPLRALVVWD